MFCVKCKKSTETVPDSERVITTKNGKNLLKAACAVCGTTKNRFLPNSYNGPREGAGIWDFIIGHPNLVNTVVGLAQAAPAIGAMAYGAKKLYDSRTAKSS